VQAHLDVALRVRCSKAGVESKCKRNDSAISEHTTIDLNAANLPKKNYKHKRKSVTEGLPNNILFEKKFFAKSFVSTTIQLTEDQKEKHLGRIGL
jgi:hypothetical protein